VSTNSLTQTLRKILRSRFDVLLAITVAVCLYLVAFIFPCTPIYQGDTAAIWILDATKMLEGQVIYRDFFEFMLPGTQIFYEILFKLFGLRAWIPNMVWVALGLGLAWGCVLISKHLLTGRAIYLPAVLFLGLGFVTEPDPTHHWFSTLACLLAIAVAMPRRSAARLMTAGALCGVATLFTQSRGPLALAGFALFLLWEWRVKHESWGWLLKAGLWLTVPFAATTLPVIFFLAWKVGVGLGTFIDSTVLFLMKYWSKEFWGSFYVYGADLPDSSSWLQAPSLLLWLFMHLLLPFVYLLFLMRYRQALLGREENWDRGMLLCIVGFFMFLSIAFSPIWFRLVAVSPPAMILFVWLLDRRVQSSRSLLGVVWVGGLLALVLQAAIVQLGWKGYLDSPTGHVAMLDPDHYQKYRWVLDHTHPGDFYFQADDCDEYFLLGLRNPTRVSFITDSAYTRPEHVQNAIAMIEQHRVRFVMWSAWLDVPRHPGDDGSAAPLRSYLRAHYHPVRNFDDESAQVWERNPGL